VFRVPFVIDATAYQPFVFNYANGSAVHERSFVAQELGDVFSHQLVIANQRTDQSITSPASNKTSMMTSSALGVVTEPHDTCT